MIKCDYYGQIKYIDIDTENAIRIGQKLIECGKNAMKLQTEYLHSCIKEIGNE